MSYTAPVFVPQRKGKHSLTHTSPNSQNELKKPQEKGFIVSTGSSPSDQSHLLQKSSSAPLSVPTALPQVGLGQNCITSPLAHNNIPPQPGSCSFSPSATNQFSVLPTASPPFYPSLSQPTLTSNQYSQHFTSQGHIGGGGGGGGGVIAGQGQVDHSGAFGGREREQSLSPSAREGNAASSVRSSSVSKSGSLSPSLQAHLNNNEFQRSEINQKTKDSSQEQSDSQTRNKEHQQTGGCVKRRHRRHHRNKTEKNNDKFEDGNIELKGDELNVRHSNEKNAKRTHRRKRNQHEDVSQDFSEERPDEKGQNDKNDMEEEEEVEDEGAMMGNDTKKEDEIREEILKDVESRNNNVVMERKEIDKANYPFGPFESYGMAPTQCSNSYVDSNNPHKLIRSNEFQGVVLPQPSFYPPYYSRGGEYSCGSSVPVCVPLDPVVMRHPHHILPWRLFTYGSEVKNVFEEFLGHFKPDGNALKLLNEYSVDQVKSFVDSVSSFFFFLWEIRENNFIIYLFCL
jgi:hypothetical protein